MGRYPLVSAEGCKEAAPLLVWHSDSHLQDLEQDPSPLQASVSHLQEGEVGIILSVFSAICNIPRLDGNCLGDLVPREFGQQFPGSVRSCQSRGRVLLTCLRQFAAVTRSKPRGARKLGVAGRSLL